MAKKPDKYDEAAAWFYDKYCELAQPSRNRDIPNIAAYLRRAFPSAPSDTESAEDALALVDRIQEIRVSCSEYVSMEMTRDEAAAEISRFAESRVEPWREALQALYDEQNGAPLIRHAKSWETAMAKAEALLSDAYQQSFQDKLANYIGLAERRGASNERHRAPAPEAPKFNPSCGNCAKDGQDGKEGCEDYYCCLYGGASSFWQPKERSATT